MRAKQTFQMYGISRINTVHNKIIQGKYSKYLLVLLGFSWQLCYHKATPTGGGGVFKGSNTPCMTQVQTKGYARKKITNDF